MTWGKERAGEIEVIARKAYYKLLDLRMNIGSMTTDQAVIEIESIKKEMTRIETIANALQK